jgi:hypothetical protein
MVNNTECPKCGNVKKSWFNFCWDCSEKDKKKPKCEVCGTDVQEGHNLCLEHWKAREAEKKKLNQIEYVEKKKKEEFREKYKGRYHFDQIPFKSKSEVIIYLFLKQNGLRPLYEEEMNFNGHCYHPDFIVHDENGNTVIIEHFGLNEENYIKGMKQKITEYTKLCKDIENFYFISTTEGDLNNLKDKLGKKLNCTPLKKPIWK